MKLSLTLLKRAATSGALLMAASAAQAHTGHGASSLFEGLVHPLGLDHVLAMVAVGLWSVTALPPARAWWGPAVFLAAMVASAALGATGVLAAVAPYLEHLISLSVVLFGVMLVAAAQRESRQVLPTGFGLALVALAGAFHGLAHGAEAPGAGFAGYALGFLTTTAALHAAGVGVGLGLRRALAGRLSLTLAGLGALLGSTGLYLFSQV